MSRLNWSLVAILVFIGFFLVSSNLHSQDFNPDNFNPAQFEEYERQLNAILKTRRDEEKAFVKAVVKNVRDGKLPAKLISTSFKWVRNRRPNTNYPFIYFERVLRLQAAKLKLSKFVPEFDYDIYSQRR